MKREEATKVAFGIGAWIHTEGNSVLFTPSQFYEFANTVENMTIERCAKLCEENCAGHSYGGGLNGPCLSAFSKESGGRHDGMTYAEAIRALKDDQ